MSEKTNVKRADLIFLYDAVYCNPNGDPFTGAQRIDEATFRALISDVRIKAYIREYFKMLSVVDPKSKHQIFLRDVDIDALIALGISTDDMSGAAAQVGYLKCLYKDDPSVYKVSSTGKGKTKGTEKVFDVEKLLKKCIDVRLFGAVSTEKGDSIHLTGPVQFLALNQSLNRIEQRVHQNTSHFVSNTSNAQGAIGTTTIVPYTFAQIIGSVNPLIAVDTGLTEEEILLMCTALWNGLNAYRSRSKMGQNSRLLLKINYKDAWEKCASIQEKIRIKDPENTNYRSISDISLDFSDLAKFVASSSVVGLEYLVEEEIKPIFLSQMKSVSSKLIAL